MPRSIKSASFCGISCPISLANWVLRMYCCDLVFTGVEHFLGLKLSDGFIVLLLCLPLANGWESDVNLVVVFGDDIEVAAAVVGAAYDADAVADDSGNDSDIDFW